MAIFLAVWVLAVPALGITGLVLWLKSSRSELPLWRNALGVFSVISVVANWAVSLPRISRPNRWLRHSPPSGTASSGEDRSPFAPSLPTTSRCDPYRPCCVDAAAKTSAAKFVISWVWLQEGRSALHRFF